MPTPDLDRLAAAARERIGAAVEGTPLERAADRLPVQTAPALRATLVAVALFVVVAGLALAAGGVLIGETATAASVDALPTSPDDEAWEDAPERTVSLDEQTMAVPRGGGSVDEVTVRAVHTDQGDVAFRLTWEDPERDVGTAGPEEYSDAAAVMLHDGEEPPISMGDAETPVNVWYWRASWQEGPGERSGDFYAYPQVRAEEARPGVLANNPVSSVDPERPAQNYYVRGFGSLTHAPDQNVRGVGERTDDGWQVVLWREGGPEGQHDVALDDDRVYLAFAVWDGSEGEVSGMKSISWEFTPMETEDGQFVETDDGDGSDGDGAGGTGGASLFDALGSSVTSFVLGLVAVTVAAWLVTYRSMRD